ncbi:NHLP leader peptide family natural product precursor [Nostoc flagelliforme FACHB-838]|uniref:NHLP leader peptide family natural product n=1 Tax=Nostoc flagelliforme FACHB-838 TaxID=2692904 RepID=A0ABR8DXS8_9NOSO|nr:NHLP leader peptide family RiPP precursor [Nostoc flagelliforme]MBD2533204.1 NHLP leader peptide family natural product precursor [Nostoc flagelliforme FACHB-838]
MIQPNNTNDVQSQIIAKALRDSSFRQSLFNEPKAAISQELGIDIPDSINIQVLQANDTNLYLVLPSANDDEGDAELSLEQLASVAGGRGSTICSWSKTCLNS